MKEVLRSQALASGRTAARGVRNKTVRTYEITVTGFGPLLYNARTPGKARARCYRDYCGYSDCTTFRQFLGMSRIRRVDNPPGICERILVAGLPAVRVIGYGQYVHFMRDDSDTILCAHPSDVTLPDTEQGGASQTLPEPKASTPPHGAP